MKESDHLNELYSEIVAYVKDSGLNVFPGELFHQEGFRNEAIWDSETDDWKSFVKMAKEEGIKTIVIQTERGEDDKADIIGSIKVAWGKDGMLYVFQKETKWWKEEKEREEEEYGAISTEDGIMMTKKAEKELQNKSEEQLAQEMEECMLENLGKINYERPNLFWEQIGVINRYALPPDLGRKLDKVDSLVMKKQIEEEKKLLPKLIEECSEWAKSNDLSKVTKSNLKWFMTERGIQLSRYIEDALFNGTNFKIKSKK